MFTYVSRTQVVIILKNIDHRILETEVLLRTVSNVSNVSKSVTDLQIKDSISKDIAANIEEKLKSKMMLKMMMKKMKKTQN